MHKAKITASFSNSSTKPLDEKDSTTFRKSISLSTKFALIMLVCAIMIPAVASDGVVASEYACLLASIVKLLWCIAASCWSYSIIREMRNS